jgi:PAS domain-containing protein
LRKTAEHLAMASGWQIAAERLPVAVLSTDAHGHVRAFNRLVTATFSTVPEMIKGASIGRFIPGADVLIAAGVRGSGDVVRLVGLREDTGEFPLELTITRDDGGFIAVIRDLTEEVRASDVETWAQIGTFERHLVSGRVVWSPEMYRICGVDPHSYDPAARDFLDLVHPDDRRRVERTLSSSRRSTDPADAEFRIVRPDGDVRTLVARARKIGDQHIGMARDVTAQRLTPPGMPRTKSGRSPRGTEL